jgi:hypothetical protein
MRAISHGSYLQSRQMGLGSRRPALLTVRTAARSLSNMISIILQSDLFAWGRGGPYWYYTDTGYPDWR